VIFTGSESGEEDDMASNINSYMSEAYE